MKIRQVLATGRLTEVMAAAWWWKVAVEGRRPLDGAKDDVGEPVDVDDGRPDGFVERRLSAAGFGADLQRSAAETSR